MTRKENAAWGRMHCEDGLARHAGPQAASQVDGVERFLSLAPRARVLDLACGNGRQTLELARRGYRVLGIDLHEPALAEARRAAREERLNVHFLNTDFRKINYRGEFDAVLNLYASIGYLPDDRDHLRVLEVSRKALKTGGWLLLDLLNKEWLMRHFEPKFWEQGDDSKGSVVLDRIAFDFETGRLDNHRTIVGPDGEREPGFVSLRVYTLTEVKALLERAGLALRKVCGGHDGQAYGMDSPRMIVLAQKTAEAPPRSHKSEGLPTAIRIKGRRKGK